MKKNLHDEIERKYVDTIDLDDWDIETDTGWEDVSSISKTIPYEVWEIHTENGLFLKAADTHIVFNHKFQEVFIKDLVPNHSKIITKNGVELVTSVENLKYHEEMYDLDINSPNHRFYSNNILSHNSTVTLAYFLWSILFQEEYSVAILANKGALARELLGRLQKAYEHLPKWLQQGVISWNKGSLELENGSKVFAYSTSASGVRGGSFNMILLDEYAFLPRNIAHEFFQSTYPVISSGKTTKVIIVSCVTDDTYLLTDNGPKQIKELIDYSQPNNPRIGYEIDRYFVSGFNKINSGNVLVNSGKAPTKILTTKSSILECSHNHKILTKVNDEYIWKESKDIKLGDLVAIQYAQNIWGNRDELIGYDHKIFNVHEDTVSNKFMPGETISPNLAYFIGLYLAYGLLTNYRTYIRTKNNISHVLDEFKIYYREFHNKKHNYYRYHLGNSNLRDFLKYLGFKKMIDYKNIRKEKEIPQKIFSCSREIVASFLNGLFNSSKCTIEKDKIKIKSYSEKLIFQIRALLLNMGILSYYNKQIIFLKKRIRLFDYIHELEISLIDQTEVYIDEQGMIVFRGDYSIDSGKTSWEVIENIEDSENLVYDVSLDHIEGDDWCHSVSYNGMIGHQTPNGMNHYYKMWMDAVSGRSNYVPVEIHWSQVPGRDAKWKKETIRNTSIEQFTQEFESVSGDTLINVNGDEITIRELYEKLEVKKYPDRTIEKCTKFLNQ